MMERDKSIYRHKGLRETTVKTVYGEVSYKRAVYEKINDDGTRIFVYLLDETLELKNIGLISANLAENLVEGITELSHRQCEAKVSEMTDQSISAMGVWKVIQTLGEQVAEEEKEITKTHRKGHIRGKRKHRCCLRKRMVYI